MSIVVENLTKKYGEQKAVNDISFKINTGEVVGFLGPNGAGKSTTMKMITCYMAPTSGDVRLDELSILNEQEDIKKKIGYLPENNPLYTDMAIVDYLRFCAEIQGVSKAKIPSRIGDMIDMCGLERERHKKISELSKGYRQRVGLAQAMIHDPEILILDEPTTGLDPNQIIEIRKLIKKLGKEKTVILSSHILSEVEATCDRILIINRGRIVADGTSDTLRSQAEGKELLTVKIEAADADVKKALLGLASVETVEPVEGKAGFFSVRSKPDVSSRKEVFDLCVSKKWYLLEMTGHETKLEDVFRELTN
ncbi:ATP-binding cassette domain-containing protein [Imperialibacter roseus]|uniref:ATP-binding cassette domain-containing protein n=1 Tax=Imperialibacter roseus TaxID=1324217 RepID=A0ABZ0IT83_9BACT|nr:ATP-binding cassette domain-containing protein [Imperialibacter roseus]WOK08237.1 ATP-binding cassette domain-containing protein [Imperialibacter roseus]|tara:strand:+ start:3134 stop:4057 length:924 start_codon:yes stop_codon:yes gene_type:complete